MVAYGIHTGSSSLLVALSKKEKTFKTQILVSEHGARRWEGKGVLEGTEGKQWDGDWALTSERTFLCNCTGQTSMKGFFL